MPAVAAARLGPSGKSPAELGAELERFLAAPLPAQVLTWTLPTPADRSAVYPITVKADAADASATDLPLSAELILGDAAPPPLSIETDEKGNRIETVTAAQRETPIIRAVRIRYSDSRRVEFPAFFAPLAPLGWHYDFGWLGAYVLVYLVVLVPMRLLLRIP